MDKVSCIWHPQTSRNVNVYVAFQTAIHIQDEEQVSIRIFGSNLYRVYHNGEHLLDGPARFEERHPEFDEHVTFLKSGRHLFTVIVHYYGTSTRMTSASIPPFLQFAIRNNEGNVKLFWKCKEVTAYEHLGRRTNEQLGWMEHCDMRILPDWGEAFMESSDWVDPINVVNPLGDAYYQPKTIRDCLALPVDAQGLAKGRYINRFGYEHDDPPVRFLLRDLAPTIPAEGVWYRFDFQKVGLYRPQIYLDVPEGTWIEVGYSEALIDGRVSPFISLSASPSCHLDRWISKSGKQRLETYSPRGFRYLELHISAREEQIRDLNVTAEQRTYYDVPMGTFTCSDPLLNQIWRLCIETLRTNSEDALVDSPTRERGQWLGDAVAVGMEMMAVSFGAMPFIRRSLLQATYCKNEDGVVAGLYPGQQVYVSSYSLMWISGCLRYYHLTGDLSLLKECYAAAQETMQGFLGKMTNWGIVNSLLWDFLDWGHEVEGNTVNAGINLLVLQALRDIQQWERLLGREEAAAERQQHIDSLQAVILNKYVTDDGLLAKAIVPQDIHDASRLTNGYHATVLGSLLHLFDSSAKPKALTFIKEHMMNCFPNDVDAPRLSSPSANNSRLITPYFAHFALQALWEAGETEFVMEQYRVCWGWMLAQGVTTLMEVFDPRWSHCHAWSGAPAWQLSRYVLGLFADDTGDPGSFRWHPRPGKLDYAEGHIPLLHVEGVIHMKWQRTNDGWIYDLVCDVPIRLLLTSHYNIGSLVVDGASHNNIASEVIVNNRMSLIFS